MRLHNLPITILGVLIIARLLAAADVFSPALVQSKAVTLDPMIDETQVTVKWSHGAFLLAHGGSGDKSRTFYTLDREGRMLSSARAEIPDATYVSLGGSDRREDRSIVFIGQAWTVTGEAAPFIGLISAEGKTEKVIRVAPYHPYMLSIAPDGTFWTLGFEMVERNISAPELNPNAGVPRHFDRNGKLLGSSGPQSQFWISTQLPG